MSSNLILSFCSPVGLLCGADMVDEKGLFCVLEDGSKQQRQSLLE